MFVDLVKSSPKILPLRHLDVYVDVFKCIHFTVHMMSHCFSHSRPQGKTHLSILSEETSLGHLGVLLLDISVKMEIIDYFLLPRIKQKLLKNIIITLQKFLIGIDYVQPLSQFMRVKLGACFGLGLFTLDTMIKTMIRGSFLEVDIQSQRAGWSQEETSQACFSGQN